MSAAAYARGSRAIRVAIDRQVKASGASARIERESERDDRARLLARIASLEKALRRSDRARAALRAALTAERIAREEERERSDRAYRFAVRTLAKRARLDDDA